jgi:hypothetical protein
MASTINAGTTTATALNVTTDTTGTLKIQTSGVDAISINAGQLVTLTNPLPAGSGGTGLSTLTTNGALYATSSSAVASGTLPVAAGGTGTTTSTGSGNAVLSASPSLTGTPLAPTATAGTNTTQIATTAFTTTAVSTAVAALGTMSTQNANSVTITGGSITGITDLAVADGGTGASTLAANSVLLGNGSAAIQTVAPSTAGRVLASNGTTWVSTTIASSGAKLGLGITGEVWNDVTGSRSYNTSYTNSRAYPILVSSSTTCSFGARITAFVNGAQIVFFGWQFNGCGAFGGTVLLVPPGATYQLNAGEGVQNWVELY